VTGVPSLLAVFGAGVATILSPCCLPLLPAMVSSGTDDRRRPLVLVAGSILSFTLLGVLVGAVAGLSPRTFRLPFVVALIAFGAVLVDDDLHDLYSRASSGLGGRADRATARVESDYPLAGAFLTGTLLGVIWLPCVGPVLGAVLAFAGQSGDLTTSGGLLFTYGVGFAVPLVATAYLGRDALDRLGVARRVAGRRVLGAVLVATGVALLFDLDKLLMRVLVDVT
jgi:cytochrome c biogenesis protein CcdA